MGKLITKTAASMALGLALGLVSTTIASVTMVYLDGDNARADAICVDRHGTSTPCYEISPAGFRHYGEKVQH
ncbi:hypothetical protein [Rhizobium sp. BG4]|uniref:hypothetical protein n=1 Tax=Rhizobium sp. BG4 TaxID=2613770 RepID=UPI00193E8CEA|nr:hypothetical protein [Rhizobium sp. BG4]QRM45340.1 hypothetical protein F2982_18980 [Rhizobium sp. BG4]